MGKRIARARRNRSGFNLKALNKTNKPACLREFPGNRLLKKFGDFYLSRRHALLFEPMMGTLLVNKV